uniref:F-box domain-containing protein n=1 Tax=Steinernema glaseri TaxID=37863 RepID=A0A1I7YZ53_9BILA
MPSEPGIFSSLPREILSDIAYIVAQHHDPVALPVKSKDAKDLQSAELCALQHISSLRGEFGKLARNSVVDELSLGEQGQVRFFNGTPLMRRYDCASFMSDLVANRRIHTLKVTFTHQAPRFLSKQIDAYMKASKLTLSNISLYSLDNLSTEQARKVLAETPPVQKIFIQACRKNPESLSPELEKTLHDFLKRILKEGHSKMTIQMPHYRSQPTLMKHILTAFEGRRLKELAVATLHVTKRDVVQLYNIWRTSSVDHLTSGSISGIVPDEDRKELQGALETFGAQTYGETRHIELAHPFSKCGGQPSTIFFYLYKSLSINFRVQQAPETRWLDVGLRDSN